ncbi:MAG: glutamine synthetase III [Thermanaerothrix sp.]|nr:glutamine synthetase III [Thermanaerothrix sp.]
MFGENVFDRRAMRERLPREVYAQLLEVMEGTGRMDEALAGVIASAMKEWAVSKGATHYAHWFHPRNEMTAEKHMAFLTVDSDGTPLEAFSAVELIQGEPDASSFPCGSVRSTFEARGYTAWDPTSPAFLVATERGGTLCVPSVFIAFDGTPLDMKTPLLKALSALEQRALRISRLFGNRGVRWIKMTCGAEQEFFLIDAERARRRPDILHCGRTLFGAEPPKGQQMEDHYFGSIHHRVLSYMEEVEEELLRLGVAVKTRHNEVAPCQYEFAPQHCEANLACDQNQMMMLTMRRLAHRHGLRLLLHEKPFAGLNGSGKHVNFSLMDSEGRNLLSPSQNPRRNVQFLTYLAAFVLGLWEHGGLLRASTACPGNVHRLGGSEAPPVIMSIYLGEVITRVLDRIDEELEALEGKRPMDLGLNRLPSIRADNTDRNRTAPIAFTGNKLEFRSPGSSQSIAGPLTMLASAWAMGLEWIGDRMESRIASGMEPRDAALEAVREAVRRSRGVMFEGNCYSPEWEQEARRRGLAVARRPSEALERLVAPENAALLSRLGVMRERECRILFETRLEQHAKWTEIEMGVMRNMVLEGILPALGKAVRDEGAALQAAKAFGLWDPAGSGSWLLKGLWEARLRVSEGLKELEGALSKLKETASKEDPLEACRAAEGCVEAMERLRRAADLGEELCPGEAWIYPTYRQLLSLG